MAGPAPVPTGQVERSSTPTTLVTAAQPASDLDVEGASSSPITRRLGIVVVGDDVAGAADALASSGFVVRRFPACDRAALLTALGDADALVVRGATRVDDQVLAAGPRLRVVARAGVGLENIDIDAATQAGVMVVDTPRSTLVSAAEHTVGLLLALARRIPEADAALRAGEWGIRRYTGIELADKTLGVLGLGQVGALVARRLSAFGMHVIAYDPYVQPGRAAHAGVRLVSYDDVLERSDVLTIHLPRTPDTVGLIGPEAFGRMRRGVLVVNAARGGIVDEAALYDALESGRVGGAALDVFAEEPCTDSPLFSRSDVIVTPHLGDHTVEAQEKAGRAVARSVRLALAGELVPDAVNVQGGLIAEPVRPAIPLTEKLGRTFTAVAGAVPQQLAIDVRGELAGYDVKVLELAALAGLFTDVFSERVSYADVPLVANDRGMEVRLSADHESPDFRNLVTLSGTFADGRQLSVSGTLIGPRRSERIVELDGFHVEFEPDDHVVVLRCPDRPGTLASIGRTLLDLAIDVESMQVDRDRDRDRDHPGRAALVVLTVAERVEPRTLAELATRVGATSARAITLAS